jgi:hypothetical protein
MRKQPRTDEAFTRAMFQEIGERLRASLKEEEIPERLRVQLDRIAKLEEQASPSIVPEMGSDASKRRAVWKSLASRMNWTTLWRMRYRRMRK